MDEPDKRDDKGRFQPGSSGGPGRPRIDPVVKEMLLAATPKAVKRLVEALDADSTWCDKDGERHAEPDHDMRIKAANAIMDRAWGKPAQAITGEDGTPLFGSSSEIINEIKRIALPKDETK